MGPFNVPVVKLDPLFIWKIMKSSSLELEVLHAKQNAYIIQQTHVVFRMIHKNNKGNMSLTAKRKITYFADPMPTNQVEIMKKLLVTMKGIQRLMERSTPHSFSSSSSESGSSTGSRHSVCNMPAVSQAEHKVKIPSVKMPQQQLPFSLPDVILLLCLLPCSHVTFQSLMLQFLQLVYIGQSFL